MTAPIKVVCSDLDGTILGDPAAEQRFCEFWSQWPEDARPVLIYNTGRMAEDVHRLIGGGRLPPPEAIVSGIGTELQVPRMPGLAEEFAARFGSGWDLDRVEAIVQGFTGVERQPPEFLHSFKSSWYWNAAANETVLSLRGRLEAEAIDAHVDYSCHRFLDVVPRGAGKGAALRWLCERWGVALTQVIVAGDTNNDRSMFVLPGVRGIVVGNALAELRHHVAGDGIYFAARQMADGVIEGLRHWANA